MALTSKSPPVAALLNLDALHANLARVRALAPRARILAVIKADAYGHGLIRAAHALLGADGFAVARVEEGIRLRRAGIAHRIVVLQGYADREEFQAHLDHRLEPVIHLVAQADMLAAYRGARIRPWIKLDTGMNRLGLTPQAFDHAVKRLSHLQPVLMTHLACADAPDDPTTGRQLAAFEDATGSLEHPVSIANSAAILAWPRTHRDWVRPGLMLYGLSPFEGKTGAELGLQPVMTLKSRIIAVRSLRKGDSVGYGATWTAGRPTRLGVVAAGYGDGYPREVPPGTPVLIDDVRVPIVGRVSMDMLTVDLTGHPRAGPGSEVVLWGEGLPLETIARRARTIPYTLACGVTARVPRVETGGDYGASESRL